MLPSDDLSTITTSSDLGVGTSSNQIRLGGVGYWQPGTNDVNQWIEVENK